MKVYLAKDIKDLPAYGDIPDLTQGDESTIDFFVITAEEVDVIDELFIDQTNELCDATLDRGDYQYYNADQCGLMLDWIDKVIDTERYSEINIFLSKLKLYLQYAEINNTGIAIEL